MANHSSKSVTVARTLLGLGFFTFGLNGFLGFLPNPSHSGVAAQYLGALAATGYMFPFIKGTELLVGILLLSGRFVPLALTILAPVMLNILGFHLFLDPAGIAVPLGFLALQLYLAWSYRSSYAPLLRSTATPTRDHAATLPRHAAAAAE